MFRVGDRILLPDVTLKAVPADTDSAGEYVCDNGKDKCYFSKCIGENIECPRCINGHNRLVFIRK